MYHVIFVTAFAILALVYPQQPGKQSWIIIACDTKQQWLKYSRMSLVLNLFQCHLYLGRWCFFFNLLLILFFVNIIITVIVIWLLLWFSYSVNLSFVSILHLRQWPTWLFHVTTRGDRRFEAILKAKFSLQMTSLGITRSASFQKTKRNIKHIMLAFWTDIPSICSSWHTVCRNTWYIFL